MGLCAPLLVYSLKIVSLEFFQFFSLCSFICTGMRDTDKWNMRRKVVGRHHSFVFDLKKGN